MKLTEYLLAELDREAPLTRRAIEAVPEGKDDWKPHQKSMPMGRLTSLVANMPSWITMMVERDEFDVAPATPPSGPSPFAMDLKTRDERVKTIVAELPRYVMLQDSINHLAHHRGQLTVYLRLNDVPVPAIYGPSADDQRF